MPKRRQRLPSFKIDNAFFSRNEFDANHVMRCFLYKGRMSKCGVCLSVTLSGFL